MQKVLEARGVEFLFALVAEKLPRATSSIRRNEIPTSRRRVGYG
jgi:hypothetical protein